MNTDDILKKHKLKASESQLLGSFGDMETFLEYDPKTELVFDNMLVLKTALREYGEYFTFSCNNRALVTIPIQAKKVNKVLNVVKKAVLSLPRDLQATYQKLVDIDNVKELMLTDLNFLAGEYDFEVDEKSAGKKYKKA